MRTESIGILNKISKFLKCLIFDRNFEKNLNEFSTLIFLISSLLLMTSNSSYILIIDSSADICSIALCNENNIIDSADLLEKNIHSEKLTIMIEELFAKNNFPYTALSAIGVHGGPGSYTGLRIGVSVAKGMCFALDIPLLSCDGLLAYAESINDTYPEKFDFILTALDARRDEVYGVIINKNREIVLNTQPILLNPNFNAFILANCPGKIGIFSNCVEKFISLTKVNNVYFNGNELFKSVYLHKDLYSKFLKNNFENLHYFEPNYIKVGYHIS